MERKYDGLLIQNKDDAELLEGYKQKLHEDGNTHTLRNDFQKKERDNLQNQLASQQQKVHTLEKEHRKEITQSTKTIKELETLVEELNLKITASKERHQDLRQRNTHNKAKLV